MENTASNPPTNLNDKRKDTDSSLNAERGMATKSLHSASEKSQQQTNRIVQDERNISDQKTIKARKDNDEDDAVVPTFQLAKERSVSDLATENERKQADAAIEKERDLADHLVSTILDQERETTDKSLLSERQASDSQLNGAHQKLASRHEILSIVSHDLRNPIGVVSSYADLLMEQPSFGQFNQETRAHIEAIKRNAGAALRLISDLLDTERIGLNKLRIRLGTCNAKLVIEQARENFALDAKEKNIKILNRFESPETQFECDQGRISQILSNLISNALKFTPQGGTIVIGGSMSVKDVRFFVKDSGPGISEENKEQIFERFAQLENQARTGLGLGLYISKVLIEAHHGRIWVESEEGTGSTFFLQLPRHP